MKDVTLHEVYEMTDRWPSMEGRASANAQAPDSAVDAQAQLDAVKRAGSQMANIFFNLAQRPGEPIDAVMCKVFDTCRKEWDDAILAASSAHTTKEIS
jgi:hypothetical protein